jgi:hypothetical protein
MPCRREATVRLSARARFCVITLYTSAYATKHTRVYFFEPVCPAAPGTGLWCAPHTIVGRSLRLLQPVAIHRRRGSMADRARWSCPLPDVSFELAQGERRTGAREPADRGASRRRAWSGASWCASSCTGVWSRNRPMSFPARRSSRCCLRGRRAVRRMREAVVIHARDTIPATMPVPTSW